jgi:hypothetical protein
MRKSFLVGLAVGLVVGFIDSYTYALSGYTTAEVSLIVIPLLVLIVFRFFKVEYSDEDIVIATALAFGVTITTTLTSGMYITFGFLSYLSSRLRAYGLSASVPLNLFSGIFPDYNALPIYVSLALISFSGALIAFVFREHFIERERLRYPVGFASAILTKVFSKVVIGLKHYAIMFMLGFALQMIAMRNPLQLDLTPLLSSFIPGATLALTFWPIIIGLLFILPLEPLKMMSSGSLITYLVLVPLSVSLFKIKVPPAVNFEEALISYSTIIVGLLVGVVILLLVVYLVVYVKVLTTSLSMIFKLKMERNVLILAVTLLLMLGYVGATTSNHRSFLLYLFPAVFLHILLIIVNLRTVGEAGIGSQALLPLITLYLYFSGARDVLTYAILDPYTGIPMPQVVGGSAMNLLRFSRLLKYSSVKALAYFGFGMLVGSLATFIYGNVLLHVYGFNSPQMPLTRWIPTIMWMSTIYSGKLGSASLAPISIGLFIGLILIIIGLRKHLPLFSFVVGMTLPPDIGISALAICIIKRLLVELGVEVHEKTIIYSTMFMVGCILAVICETFLTAIGA